MRFNVTSMMAKEELLSTYNCKGRSNCSMKIPRDLRGQDLIKYLKP
jgi:hypothetical protein